MCAHTCDLAIVVDALFVDDFDVTDITAVRRFLRRVDLFRHAPIERLRHSSTLVFLHIPEALREHGKRSAACTRIPCARRAICVRFVFLHTNVLVRTLEHPRVAHTVIFAGACTKK